MAISVLITDTGFNATIDHAAELAAKDFQAEFQSLGPQLIERVREGFALGTDPFGNAWLPLKAITVQIKRERNSANPTKILQDTGELHDSFRSEMVEDALSIFTDRKFTDGTTAEIHQFGGTQPRSQAFIPPRRMLPMDDELPYNWERDVELAVLVGVERIFA